MRTRDITYRALRASCLAGLVVALSIPVAAQWFDFKAPGVPRLPDGKVNMSAPAPRTTDGKPDLSGVWQAGRAGQSVSITTSPRI
jgi:hypothetical protein